MTALSFVWVYPYSQNSRCDINEICLTYKQGITLGHVAGELMAIESWMDFPILVTVVIIKRSKVDAIVEARQKH